MSFNFYNQNAPLGFKPYSYVNGALWTGQMKTYPVASGYVTSLYYGDPVTLLADGTIGIGAAGAAIVGVFQGIQWTDTSGNFVYSPYWPGGTVTQGALTAQAQIVDDPNVLFSIQVSRLGNQPGPANPVALASTDVNKNANFAVATAANSFNPTVAPNAVAYAANPIGGNTFTGNSAFFLDYDTPFGNGATLNCKIVGLTPLVGNVFSAGGTASGTINFNNALVLINNHIYKGGTGTAGI